MSETGFLMLSRLLKDDPFWKNFSTDYRSIFITILLNCAWKDTIQDDHGEPTVVLKGQCLLTERQIIEEAFPPTKDAKKLAKYKSACHRSLIFFEKVGFSNHKKNHKKTLHTITKDYLLKAFEPNFEPTANQARTKLEPQKNKIRTEESIDHGLIYAEENADDSEVLEFDHKKSGSIKSTINKIIENLSPDGWTEKEIKSALSKMKKFDPCLNGSIEGYLKPILKNQKKDSKACKPSQQKKKKEELPKDKGYFMGSDLSEVPLAKFARQSGLK